MSVTVVPVVKLGRMQILHWADIDRWIPIGGQVQGNLAAGWQRLRLGDLVTQVISKEKLEPTQNYPLAGVRLDGGGVYHRETVIGADTSASHLTRLQPGCFIYGRLFGWRGAFAAVKDEHGDLWCSNEFPQFKIDTDQLDVNYLVRYMLHPKTLERVGQTSVGTAAVSRNRFKEIEFTETEILLPPLETQRNIVVHWQSGMARAAALEAEAAKLVEEAREGFLEELGIRTAVVAEERRRVFALEWASIGSWHGASNLKRLAMGDVHQGRYPVMRGRDCLTSISHGCSVSPVTGSTGLEVLPISSVTKGFLDLSKRKHIPNREKLRAAYTLQQGDVLMCRTNGTLAYVGMSALVEADHANLIFPDKVIRVRTKDNLRPDYLWLLLQTPPLRAQIEAAARTAVGNYAIGGKDIWDFEFPVPPKEVQVALAKKVIDARARVAMLKEQAEAKRKETKEEVEGMVMGTNQ